MKKLLLLLTFICVGFIAKAQYDDYPDYSSELNHFYSNNNFNGFDYYDYVYITNWYWFSVGPFDFYVDGYYSYYPYYWNSYQYFNNPWYNNYWYNWNYYNNYWSSGYNGYWNNNWNHYHPHGNHHNYNTFDDGVYYGPRKTNTRSFETPKPVIDYNKPVNTPIKPVNTTPINNQFKSVPNNKPVQIYTKPTYNKTAGNQIKTTPNNRQIQTYNNPSYNSRITPNSQHFNTPTGRHK